MFTTDGFKHYPKHLPRNSNPAYFQDMSAWAGASGGIQHVHLELPGMAGSLFQLRFEFTQDQFGTCADVRPGQPCGVSVDNVVVRNMVAAAQPSVTLVTALQSLVRDPATNDIVASVQVTNTGSTTAFNVALSSALLGATASERTAAGDWRAGTGCVGERDRTVPRHRPAYPARQVCCVWCSVMMAAPAEDRSGWSYPDASAAHRVGDGFNIWRIK